LCLANNSFAVLDILIGWMQWNFLLGHPSCGR